MQCVNCSFENMPGVQQCGRCGTSLQLASATIDVHPPRASRISKSVRKIVPYPLLDALGGSFRQALRSVLRDAVFEGNASGILMRVVVPGWPQIYAGHMVRGRCFLYAYLVCLLLGLFFVATPLGSVLLGVALMLHASSILDLFASATGELPERTAYCIFGWLIVGLLVYWPLTWAALQVAAPQRILQAVEPLAAGDVILYSPLSYRAATPQPGDVVLYDLPPLQLNYRGAGGPVQLALRGRHIDRILAGPGQRLEWRDEQLVLDGEPVPWAPLNAAFLPDGWSVTPQAGYYVVVPSTDPWILQQLPPDQLSTVSLVPESRILGRAYLRLQPFWRMWWIR